MKTRIRVLSLSIDPALLSPEAPARERQTIYAGPHRLDILLAVSGAAQIQKISEQVRLILPGGASKPMVFLRCLWFILRLSSGSLRSYDLVTTQDPTITGFLGWLAAHKLRVPLVVQLHGDFLDNPSWIKQRSLNRVLNVWGKWLIRHSEGVRCVSKRLVDQASKAFHVRDERLVSLPICTDLRLYSSEGDRYEPGLRLLFVGRLINEKEPMLFCQVAASILALEPTLTVVIAGTGTLQTQMEAFFRGRGFLERVTFTGYLSPLQLAKWYRSCLCLLHTASWEGWGMPMIEAMACGCPVVTTDTGCANEAIMHEVNGLIVAVHDEQAMQASVIRLIRDPALRARLSQQAIQTAASWSFNRRAHEQFEFYQSIIQRHAS